VRESPFNLAATSAAHHKGQGGILEQEEDPYRCTSCDRAPSLPRLFSSTRLSYAEAIVRAPASSVEVFQYQSNCVVFI